MQKNTKRDLEKVVFYCAIFKCVIGKEDELLGWLVWPIYKVDNDSKNVNMGVFTTSIFKKPAQKPPFSEKKEKSDIQLNFVRKMKKYEINFLVKIITLIFEYFPDKKTH